jgi:hypothetical protein
MTNQCIHAGADDQLWGIWSPAALSHSLLMVKSPATMVTDSAKFALPRFALKKTLAYGNFPSRKIHYPLTLPPQSCILRTVGPPRMSVPWTETYTLALTHFGSKLLNSSTGSWVRGRVPSPRGLTIHPELLKVRPPLAGGRMVLPTLFVRRLGLAPTVHTVRCTLRMIGLIRSALLLFGVGTLIGTPTLVYHRCASCNSYCKPPCAILYLRNGRCSRHRNRDWATGSSARTLPRHPDPNHVMELIIAPNFKLSRPAYQIVLPPRAHRSFENLHYSSTPCHLLIFFVDPYVTPRRETRPSVRYL